MDYRPEEYPFCIVNATVEENASINKHAQRLACERLRLNGVRRSVRLAPGVWSATRRMVAARNVPRKSRFREA
jgi:hypothetical protein